MLLWLALLPAAGFNAVRLPFNFTNLQKDLPAPKWDATEFYSCVVRENVSAHPLPAVNCDNHVSGLCNAI